MEPQTRCEQTFMMLLQCVCLVKFVSAISLKPGSNVISLSNTRDTARAAVSTRVSTFIYFFCYSIQLVTTPLRLGTHSIFFCATPVDFCCFLTFFLKWILPRFRYKYSPYNWANLHLGSWCSFQAENTLKSVNMWQVLWVHTEFISPRFQHRFRIGIHLKTVWDRPLPLFLEPSISTQPCCAYTFPLCDKAW